MLVNDDDIVGWRGETRVSNGITVSRLASRSVVKSRGHDSDVSATATSTSRLGRFASTPSSSSSSVPAAAAVPAADEHESCSTDQHSQYHTAQFSHHLHCQLHVMPQTQFNNYKGHQYARQQGTGAEFVTAR